MDNQSQAEFISEADLEGISDEELESLAMRLNEAHKTYNQKMNDIYARQRSAAQAIHKMIDQQKINAIHAQLRSK